MRTAFRYRTGLSSCAVATLIAASACGSDDERPEGSQYATGGRDAAAGTGGHGATSGGRTATGGSAICTECQAGDSGEPGVCGDGALDPGETCDDGNLGAEDGCTSECGVEPGWVCELSLPCRPLSPDASCSDACWGGDACIENASGVTCSCPDARPDDCEDVVFRSLSLPEGWSACDALAVSGDGSTAVGVCSRTNQDNQELVTVPVVWELGGGVRVLDDAPGGSVLNSVNADGSVFVGFDGQGRALRFEDGELEVLAETGIAWSTNADGSVVVGFDETQAFRWDSDAGLTLLEGPNGETESYALAVTADGAWIAGLVRDAGHARAVRWNADGEAEFLPVPEDTTDSEAVAINDDGSVVVGTIWVEDESQAVRWSEDGFEVLSGDPPSTARAVSADGSKIVGSVAREPGIWDAAGDFQSLRDALSGANLEAWSFSRVAGISSDGGVVVGTANYVGADQVSPEGRAFVAFVP